MPSGPAMAAALSVGFLVAIAMSQGSVEGVQQWFTSIFALEALTIGGQ
jgi:hypothetical protein